eukprot:2666932-Amphidinium_carterae.1
MSRDVTKISSTSSSTKKRVVLPRRYPATTNDYTSQSGTTAETLKSSTSEVTTWSTDLATYFEVWQQKKGYSTADMLQQNDENEGILWDKTTELLGLVEEHEGWRGSDGDKDEGEILMKYFDTLSEVQISTTRRMEKNTERERQRIVRAHKEGTTEAEKKTMTS